MKSIEINGKEYTPDDVLDLIDLAVDFVISNGASKDDNKQFMDRILDRAAVLIEKMGVTEDELKTLMQERFERGGQK